MPPPAAPPQTRQSSPWTRAKGRTWCVRVGRQRGGGRALPCARWLLTRSPAAQPCVILGLVRSGQAGAAAQPSQLLANWRRLNVALTRAQCKLIVLGSAEAMAHQPFTAALFDLARARGWLAALPPQVGATGVLPSRPGVPVRG